MGVPNRAGLFADFIATEIMTIRRWGDLRKFNIKNRELEIISDIANGIPYRQIAERHGFASEGSLKVKLYELGDKLGFRGRSLFVTAAVLTNLLDPFTRKPVTEDWRKHLRTPIDVGWIERANTVGVSRLF